MVLQGQFYFHAMVISKLIPHIKLMNDSIYINYMTYSTK